MNLKTIILSILACVTTSIVVAQNREQSLEIDASSFAPVHTDALTGVAIDPIGLDRSRRPCARIKMHVNRMTREEIDQLTIHPIGGNVLVMKKQTAIEGNGIIIELTAKSPTRFYLHHEKYGDSNEVSLNLEGNKEYRLEAQLNIMLPIVISSNIKGAEVYVDEQFKGTTGDDFTLTVRDVVPGAHKIAVSYGAARNEQTVDVNSNNISFRIAVNTSVARPQIVIFEVEPKDAIVMIENKPYVAKNGFVQAILQNGSYKYRVMAQGYHDKEDSLTVAGAKISRRVVLTADEAIVTVQADGDCDIWINNEYKGRSPWKGTLLSGTYIFEARKEGYQPTVTSQEITSESNNQCYTLEAPKPINGSFYISSDPIMADIFVDGKKMGQTPLMLDLVVGKHKLILQKEGYVTIEKEIEIVEGKSLELSFNLNTAVDHFTPGKASYDAKNYTEAIAHFTRGAEQGDAKSECWLGVCLYHGYGTNVDYAQAVNYFTRSAEKGYAEAQFQLANCYLTGNGVKRNTATAAKLLQKAALQNHKQAQRRLAACYETGVGVPRNTMMAMTWYKIASGQIQLPKQQQQ